MAAITISETTPNPPIHIGDGDPVLHGYYSQRYLDSDGATPIMPGDGKEGFFYSVQCSVDGDGNLVIPEFVIRTTDDGIDIQTSRFTGQLFIDDVPDVIIFGFAQASAGWMIPASFGDSVTWDQLDVFNQGAAQLGTDYSYYLAANATVALILSLIADAATANALGGILSANRIPRAATESTLTDSQIQDDGTNVTIDTLNTVQFGDVDDNQNGSYISVDDTDGRANLFAGGEEGAQYAGVAAVAGESQSELYLQGSFGNGYNYGAFVDGVAKIGDALEENNGTFIEVDDVLELITLHNLPTSDPTSLNALWKDGAFIKISAG